MCGNGLLWVGVSGVGVWVGAVRVHECLRVHVCVCVGERSCTWPIVTMGSTLTVRLVVSTASTSRNSTCASDSDSHWLRKSTKPMRSDGHRYLDVAVGGLVPADTEGHGKPTSPGGTHLLAGRRGGLPVLDLMGANQKRTVSMGPWPALSSPRLCLPLISPTSLAPLARSPPPVLPPPSPPPPPA